MGGNHKKCLEPEKTGFPFLDATVLVPAWWPVLLEAFLAVNWTAFCWLEWYFAFLSAVTTNGLVHFAWTTIVVAPFSITHNFHSYYIVDNRNLRFKISARINDTPLINIYIPLYSIREYNCSLM